MATITDYNITVTGALKNLRQLAEQLEAAVVLSRDASDAFIDAAKLGLDQTPGEQVVGLHGDGISGPETNGSARFLVEVSPPSLSSSGFSNWRPPLFLPALAAQHPQLVFDLRAVTEDELREHVRFHGTNITDIDVVHEDWRDGIYRWECRDGIRYNPPLITGPNGWEPGEDPDFDEGPSDPPVVLSEWPTLPTSTAGEISDSQ